MARNIGLLVLVILAGCSPTPVSRKAPKVDARLALAETRKAVSFGARPSGSKSLEKLADYVQHRAVKLGASSVSVQVFEDLTPHGRLTFRNVVVQIPGESQDFVVLGGHYDTKVLSSAPEFRGANDGGSSTGLLLALIDGMVKAKTRPPYTIRCVFFDGEECLIKYGPGDGLHGSKHYAKVLETSSELAQCKAVVVVDMVGDKDLQVTLSSDTDSRLSSAVYSIAKSLGYQHNFRQYSGCILDDHVPFQEKGIPAIDIIDFEFGEGNRYWHTTADDMTKIDEQSLGIVGDVVLELLWSLDSHIQ